MQLILELGLPFAGFEQDEKKEKQEEQQTQQQQLKPQQLEKETEEMVTMVCGTCKKDWALPKKAMLAFEQKNLPLPAQCKNCQRKKNIQSGWK